MDFGYDFNVRKLTPLAFRIGHIFLLSSIFIRLGISDKLEDKIKDVLKLSHVKSLDKIAEIIWNQILWDWRYTVVF